MELSDLQFEMDGRWDVLPIMLPKKSEPCNGSLIEQETCEYTSNSSIGSTPIEINNGGKSPIYSDLQAQSAPFRTGTLDKRVILYKTESCRALEEVGYCKYGNRCQFAHDPRELRPAPRHPRYKTEVCRTYWELGTCPYGKRCCFIHNELQAEGTPIASSMDQFTKHLSLRSESRLLQRLRKSES